MKISRYLIVFLVIAVVSVNILLLTDQKLIAAYFKWVNGFTGIVLLVILLITWFSKKCLDKQKADYAHKIFSKN